MCRKRGEKPDRPFSGKFLVRIDPDLHRDVANAAAREGKSLNQYATDLLKQMVVREEPPRTKRRRKR